MQTDMHYYGTFAMARAAGLREDVARAIATAAEYVDDSDRLDVTCIDGFEIHAEPTAHHPTDFKENTDPQDQRRTWVPFHFLPGNEGSTVDEKLRCVKDSAVARAVVSHTLENIEDKSFGLSLLGILAHSYVDTFSHYGFSGISSDVNLVDPESFQFHCSAKEAGSLQGRWERWAARYAIVPLANFLVKLGHGSVATFPDQPFLRWEFAYLNPRRESGLRENPKTFMEGCRRLHDVFVQASGKFNGDLDEPGAYRDFDDIEKAVAAVLAVEGGAEERQRAWSAAAAAGAICGVAKPIPAYEPGLFTRDLNRLSEFDESFARKTQVFLFLEAAKFHRNYLLNELLPAHGIQIATTTVDWPTGRTK